MRFSVLAVAALLAGFCIPGTSQANTISIVEELTGVSDENGSLLATLSSTGSFVGLNGGGTTSATTVIAFDVSPSDPASEAAFLDTLLVPPGTFTTGTQTSLTGSPISFTLNSAFFSVKLGEDTAFFKDLSGTLALTFTQIGEGAGLSHFTTFGPAVNPVPVPGAFLLLGSVLGGAAGFAGWRKKRRENANA